MYKNQAKKMDSLLAEYRTFGTVGFSGNININTASLEELVTLPGIGKFTAVKILEYRKNIGKFNKINEICNVKGIGEKTFKRIKDRIVVE
jgi:competence protein ComEA